MKNSLQYADFAATLDYPPTAEQANVITATAPAMLVIAGAGSGKTTTMSQRIAWKIVSGSVRPDQVLGLTFTRKAAGELAESAYREIENAKRKLAQTRHLPKADLTRADLNSAQNSENDPLRENQYLDRIASTLQADLMRPAINTYNSFASEIATAYAMLIGEDPRARLITDAERWQIMSEVVQNTQIPAWNRKVLREGEESAETIIKSALHLAAEIIDNAPEISDLSDYLAREITLIEELSAAGRVGKQFRGTEASAGFQKLKAGIASLKFRKAILPYVEAYFSYKKANSVIEFADQISWAYRILRDVPAVGKQLRAQYKLILLDEYQDTSVSQARLLEKAFVSAESVCAVGDPNQAIYGWRGASANALSDFVQRFSVAKTDQLTLSISFRNPKKVLTAANKITAKFNKNIDLQEIYASYAEPEEIGRPWLQEPIINAEAAQIDIPELKSLANAKMGRVVHVHRHLQEESYAAIADQIAKDFTDLRQNNGKAPTGAVLIRKHEIAEKIGAALAEKNLEYEIVGGTPVITLPEIRTIRALLQLSVSDLRNDALMYLFNYFAFGSADITAFANVRKKLQKYYQTQNITGVLVNLVHLFELCEEAQADTNNIHHAPVQDRQQTFAQGAAQFVWQEMQQNLSHVGQQRLAYLCAAICNIKENLDLPLPQLIQKAADFLQLPVLIAARLDAQAKVFGAINLFTQMSVAYSRERGAQLADFLQWIDEVEARERLGQDNLGDDLALLEVPETVAAVPGKVTILTVHAAKGLQWDVVAVPEMVANKFDVKSNNGLSSWHSSKAKLPDPLRADAAHLPLISIQDIKFQSTDPELCKGEAGCRYYDYYYRKLTKYYADEQRRLAYVAFTRPKHSLILASYDCESIARAQKFAAKIESGNTGRGNWKPTQLSAFLDELLVAQYCEIDPANDPLLTDEKAFHTWAKQFSELGNSNSFADPHAFTEKIPQKLYWPIDVDRSLVSPETLAKILPEAISDTQSDEIIAQVKKNLALFVENPAADSATTAEITYFTASGIVALANDPAAYLKDQLRPIPAKPLMTARIGTAVHAKIANFFQHPQYFDLDTTPDLAQLQIEPESEALDPQIAQLYARFTSSRFASLPPLAIEESLELTIADKPVRCVIDAVFDTSKIPGAAPVTIVDWKSGKRPNDTDLLARQLQLTLYQHAWARSTQTPLSDIAACFYYLGEADPQKRELHIPALSFVELSEQIKQKLTHATEAEQLRRKS